MRTILIAAFTIALATMASWTFAQQDSPAYGEEATQQAVEERLAESEAAGAGAEDSAAEMSDEQFAAFLMQLGVLSQRFERTTPEMRQALLFVNGLMLLNSSEEEIEAAISDTLDLLENTNLPNPIDAPLKPTGNGLLDAYLAEVERQVYAIRLDAEDWSAEVGSVGIPTPEFLAACAEEHGSEPDYWELKYVAALAADSKEQALDVFAEAEQAGRADSELLCNWYKALQAVHREQTSQATDMHTFEVYGCFTDEMFTEKAAILDKAIALDPGNAWPYYQRALINLARCNDADGLRDLQAGRAATEYMPPLLFPLREIRASYYEDSPAGSAVADGAILAHYLKLSGTPMWTVNGLLIKQSVVTTFADSPSSDSDLAAELWNYLVRTGQLPGLERMDYLMTMVGVRYLLRAVGGQDKLPQLHPDAYMLGVGLTTELREAIFSTKDYFASAITMSIAGGMPGYYAGFYAIQEAECDFDVETATQAFADLAEFDIRSMTPPPSWEKYREVGVKRLAEIEERKHQQEQAEQEQAMQEPAVEATP